MPSDINNAFDASAEPVETIRKVQRELGRLYHDTNNPLAIVSGNAQFLLELARAMELDDDLVQAMRDIEEASERVAEGLREISRLRDRISEYVDQHSAGGTS